MQRHGLALLVLSFLLSLTACVKDPSPAPIPPNPGPRTFVICEGSYGNGNSALTVYYSDTGIVVADIYAQVNGHSLGDVFQSMIHTSQDFFWLCINNSDRITVIGNGSMADVATIQIPKPRYVVQASNSKAYVSTLFSDKVYVVNAQTNTVTKVINMPFKNPEGMALAGDKLWVATWDSAAKAVYSIDTVTDAISAPMAIAGAAPQEILQDAEGMLWVLSGNDAQGIESKLTRLNPADGAILKSYSFGTADVVRPAFNRTKDTLYFIEVSYSGGSTNNGVYRMGIHDAGVPAQPFVAARGLQYFWGVGIHPQSGNVYVADPKGFTQKGMVRVYRPDGSAVDSFATGVGPGHFLFEQ